MPVCVHHYVNVCIHMCFNVGVRGCEGVGGGRWGPWSLLPSWLGVTLVRVLVRVFHPFFGSCLGVFGVFPRASSLGPPWFVSLVSLGSVVVPPFLRWCHLACRLGRGVLWKSAPCLLAPRSLPTVSSLSSLSSLSPLFPRLPLRPLRPLLPLPRGVIPCISHTSTWYTSHEEQGLVLCREHVLFCAVSMSCSVP
jgi:hypothetical protein